MKTFTISLPAQVAQLVDAETKKKGFATRSEFFRNLLRNHFVAEIKEDVPFYVFQPKPLDDIRSEFEKSGKYNKKFIESLMEGLSSSSVYANKASQK